MNKLLGRWKRPTPPDRPMSILVTALFVIFILGLFGLWVNETAAEGMLDQTVPSVDTTYTKFLTPNTNYRPLFLVPEEA